MNLPQAANTKNIEIIKMEKVQQKAMLKVGQIDSQNIRTNYKATTNYAKRIIEILKMSLSTKSNSKIIDL